MLEKPTPNLPLLRKTLDHIDAHPEEWNQWVWGVSLEDPTSQEYRASACGTAFCVAGHTVIETGHTPDWVKRWINISSDSDRQVEAWTFDTVDGGKDVEKVAAEELGISSVEAGFLFDGGNGREQVQYAAEQIAERAGEVL